MTDQPSLRQRVDRLITEYRGEAVADVLVEMARRMKAAEDALLSFTPDGSEYYNRDGDGFRVDIEACKRVIRERYTHLHEARVELASLRSRLQKEDAS